MDPTKTSIRAVMRDRRRRLPLRERRAASRALLGRIRTVPYLRAARHVGLYFSNDGEIDPGPILLHLLRSGKRCYVPVLGRRGDRRLRFAPYRLDTPLRPNRLRIPEPVIDPTSLRAARKLDLILLPLVAFDRTGGRLGMGGGFYDTTLAFLRVRERWVAPKVLGLAYAFQEVARVPRDAWDIPMDGVVTDREVLLDRTRQHAPATHLSE